MGRKEGRKGVSSVKMRTEPGALTCRSKDSALIFGRHLESGGWEAKGPGAGRAEVKTLWGVEYSGQSKG